MYSDNSTNFKGAQQELHELYKMFHDKDNYRQIFDYVTDKVSNGVSFPLIAALGWTLGKWSQASEGAPETYAA